LTNDAAPRDLRRSRLDAIGATREDAFPDALRHTARVMRLRRLVLWGAAAIVGLLLVALAIQALRSFPIDLNFARVALQGSRITIESPKLVGYRKDGRAYELHAKVASQDMTTPDIFDLEEMEVRMENNSASFVNLAAAKGVYNRKQDHADLTGGVRIFDEKRFDMRLERAAVDFKASVMTSDRPVTLKIENGEVFAKSVKFSQNERRATFVGDVHSVLYGQADSEDATKDQASQAGE
jgi:lipopolysaccharide export system protein LptC